MKLRSLALTCFAAAAAICSLAQETIPVHLGAAASSPVIGSLPSPSLAIPAPWPEGVAPDSAWQPVYYKGSFDVYVSSSDIAKDLTPKPGAPYYLEPSESAVRLSLATSQDNAELLAVDPMFCKARVETILTAYVPSRILKAETAAAQAPIHAAGDTSSAATSKAAKTIQGILLPTSGIEKSRSGCAYKIVNADKAPLAYLNSERLPAFLMLHDYINKRIDATGILVEEDGLTKPVLYAASLRKTD